MDLCVSEVLRLERETFIAPTEEELSDGDMLRSVLWRTISTCNHIAGSQDNGQVSLRGFVEMNFTNTFGLETYRMTGP